MNLELIFAEESPYRETAYPLRPIQIPLFPKKALWPAHRLSNEQIERILRKVSARELCGKRQVEAYLRRQLRHYCRPSTIRSSGTTIILFLEFFKRKGHSQLSDIGREHICAFIEHEQDRGLAPTSVDNRLKALYAFLNFLVDHDVIAAEVLKRKLRIKVPDALPRAIDPDDIRQLLAVIKKPRDRALILTLLRTGMRIGELLATKIEDLNLREQFIQIMEAQKNRVGRVVYLSSDAVEALTGWLKTRKYQSKYIFDGQDAGPLSYEAARAAFKKCLDQSGLSDKGYTLHCLRHTYASELLNAGMPLQCLQELLGHRSIEMTRRYARLTDNSRRQAYYKAMAIIESGEINGHYRFDYQLS
jgi:integrase/recombinase XerD